ncbi:MAG: VTT domain-containing protein [Niameybacter sp.]
MNTITTTTTLTKKLIHISSILGIVLTSIFLIYGFKQGIFTSSKHLSAFIQGLGLWGPVIFIVIQIIQVIIPIIPGGLSCVAGVLLFGPINGFLYNYLGILIGSIIVFGLARYYGTTFIQTFVPQNTYKKYIGWLDKGSHFDKWFALAIFLPVAPDDFLCMLAGLTKMSYKRFIAIVVLGKPASLLVYSLGLTSLLQALAHTLG